MLCDIIIPVWDQFEYTGECVRAIMKNTAYPYRLILVDNGSGAETRGYLDLASRAEGGNITVIRNNENAGFVKAVNQGLAASSAPYVCVMNNDTIPGPGWLERMMDFAEAHPDVGLINPQCDGHGDTPIDVYAGFLAKNKGEYMEMNQCQGFCMLIKRSLIEKIGYLDEAFGIGGFDDTDYSMRAHLAGYRSVAIRDSYVYHRLHASFDRAGNRQEWVKRNQKIYYDKWGKHLRVGIPLLLNGPGAAALSNAIAFAHGMAREWSWVHLWLNSNLASGAVKELAEEARKKNGLPPHQNVRIDSFRLPGSIFRLTILGKFLERLKPRMRSKRFDGLVTPDRGVVSLIRPFTGALGVRAMEVSFDDSGRDWYGRGRELALSIKKEVRT